MAKRKSIASVSGKYKLSSGRIVAIKKGAPVPAGAVKVPNTTTVTPAAKVSKGTAGGSAKKITTYQDTAKASGAAQRKLQQGMLSNTGLIAKKRAEIMGAHGYTGPPTSQITTGAPAGGRYIQPMPKGVSRITPKGPIRPAAWGAGGLEGLTSTQKVIDRIGADIGISAENITPENAEEAIVKTRTWATKVMEKLGFKDQKLLDITMKDAEGKWGVTEAAKKSVRGVKLHTIGFGVMAFSIGASIIKDRKAATFEEAISQMMAQSGLMPSAQTMSQDMTRQMMLDVISGSVAQKEAALTGTAPMPMPGFGGGGVTSRQEMIGGGQPELAEALLG